MYMTIKQFVDEWKNSSDATRKLMGVLTDAALNQSVADNHRTLGRIAWHIATTIPEMGNKTGLKIDGPKEDAPLPNLAFEIMDGYDVAAKSLLEQVKENWSDEDLKIEEEMYGEKWSREFTLRVLHEHEIHHRGQMTILMRQAGLEIPGLFGPSKEEWSKFGMPEPKI